MTLFSEIAVPMATAVFGWFGKTWQTRRDGPRLSLDRKRGCIVNVGNGHALDLIINDPSRCISAWLIPDVHTTLAPGEAVDVDLDAIRSGNGVYVTYSSDSWWSVRLARTPTYDDPWSLGRWASFIWSGIRPWRRDPVFRFMSGRRFMQRFTENGLESRTRQSYRRIQPIMRMYETHHNPWGGPPLTYDELLQLREEKKDNES